MKTIKLIMFRFFVLAFCLMTGISAYADGAININTGTGTGTGWSFNNGVLSITKSGYYSISGTGAETSNCIVVNNGVNATVSIDNVNINNNSNNNNNITALSLNGASVTLLLKNANIFKSGYNCAGIAVPSNSKLIIDSKENPGYFSGSLTANGGAFGAGIGSELGHCGTINIKGGTIIATGGPYAAGIGGGSGGGGGNITINGGIVTALVTTYDYSNSDNPACIGGGSQGNAGIINITGGAVVAKGDSGTGIGCASNYAGSSPGNINITGGTVYSTKGIGKSGQNGPFTPTTITGYAIVFANQINPNATKPTLMNNNYNIDSQGNITTTYDGFVIPASQTLIIPNGLSLTIPSPPSGTDSPFHLMNSGIIQNYGTIIHNGAIYNFGQIINYSTITGSGQGASSVKTGIHGEWIQDIPSQIYTGTAIIPNNVIVINGSTTLTKGVDYNIKNYNNNVNAGMATVTIEGIGGYAGFMTKAFSINPRPLTLNEAGMSTITIADIPDSYDYMGDSIKPDITITDDYKTLILNKDYAVSYNNNVIPGEASITITGIGNYSGTISKTFDITYPSNWQSVINVMNVNSSGLGYAYNNNLITINQDGYYQLTGTTNNNRVAVQSGITATIILDSVSITSSNHALDVSSGSTVTLLLKNSNTFQTTETAYAALHVPFGSTIIISSADGSGSVNGTLTVNGNSVAKGAGIGSDYNEGSTGDITIDGGTVNAHGRYGAGIGGGENCIGGKIVINGGIINAYGNFHGAGIGGGYNSSNSGSIIINGGVINANNSGGTYGAGIGGGANTNTGSIEIFGGIINAIGSPYGAAIGGGMNGAGGNITIYEGTINASGGVESAGIGGGILGSGGNITIYGGSIFANGGTGGGAGIGGGHSGGSGTFSMNGNAIVFASSVSDNSPKTKGILFNGNTGVMYSNVILKQNATIPSGKTWTISSDQIFEIAPNDTLTHNGIIYNNGMINNFGTIAGNGTINNNPVIDIDNTEYDNFDIYEAKGKLSIIDIIDSQDVTGGIIGTIGFDDYDDEDDFYDPIIDVVVLDKETNTIIYEIYLDETSTTYKSSPWPYFNDEVGKGGEFFPDIWESDDILSSIMAITQFHEEYGYSYIQDSIDVIVKATVYNAKLNSVKIPGIGNIGFEEDYGSASLLGFWDWVFSKKKNCFDPSLENDCPCNIWKRIKTPDRNKNSDLIVAAHRGTWGENLGAGAPENSSSAIRATVGKTPIIEVDVMGTKDGKLVLSHDYGLKRLSEYTPQDPEKNAYWFDQNYFVFFDQIRVGAYRLRKRNGTLSEDRYLLYTNMLDILQENGLVAFIDIKPLMKEVINGECLNCEYDPKTPKGRELIKNDWIKMLKKCIEIAEKKDALDYVAFKPIYKPFEITFLDNADFAEFYPNAIPEKQFTTVRYMPVIQPTNKKEWDAELWYNSVGLISSWLQYYPDNVVAIETNFKSLDEAYFKPFTIAQESYNNIFQYVDLCGLRPGIFSEDPVGPKGLASRWGDWHMKNSATDIRGDHLLLMSAPYFKTAVITGDRYDVWFQIDSIYNLPPSSSGVIAHFEGNTSTGTDIANTATESIIIRYISGSIVIDGLNKNDIDSDIILYDTQGRLIYKDKVKNSPQTTISTILPRGIYILKLSGNRQITVKLSIN